MVDRLRLERLLSSLHATDSSTPVLQRICAVCVDATSLDWAGVSRLGDGRHELLVGSDGKAERLESLQVEFAEGPCVDAVDSRRPLGEVDLASPTARSRWPNFAPAALGEGVAAVFAFPLMTSRGAVGALDVYAARPRELDGPRRTDALVLADLAALSVRRLNSSGPAGIEGVSASSEPAEAWAHPAVVHQATGMVSQQLDISVDEALVQLRAVAFSTGRRVADLARDIVARRHRLEPWVNDE